MLMSLLRKERGSQGERGKKGKRGAPIREAMTCGEGPTLRGEGAGCRHSDHSVILQPLS